jgi:SAM-dependent methyltransferase
VPPLRRELVADREMAYEEVERLLGDEGGRLRLVLIRRPGWDGWMEAFEGQPIHPGDALALYSIDPTRPEELDAVNALFSARYYPVLDGGLWPDEERVIADEVPWRGARVLEICAGAGRVTRHLVRDGNDVVGLDRAHACLAAARARDGDRPRYVAGVAQALPFADAVFDGAMAFENALGTLFARRAEVLVELVRVTRPGGRVLVGFREVAGVPAGRLHLYVGETSGYLEVAHTFDGAAIEALVEALPAPARARVASLRHREGGPRPWGGSQRYLVVELAGSAGGASCTGEGVASARRTSSGAIVPKGAPGSGA